MVSLILWALVATPKDYAAHYIHRAVIAEEVPWNASEQEAMLEICYRESRYTHWNQNPDSTAYGLYQFLDATWQYYGIAKTPDPYLQTVAAIRYIKDRYETPKKALAFWKTRHYIGGRWVHYY